MPYKKLPRRFSHLGIRAQLVWLFVGVFGVFFVLFSAAAFIYISKSQQKEFDSALYNYVIDVSHSIDLSHLKSSPHAPQETEMILPFSVGETLLQISDEKGRVLLRSRSLGSRTLPHQEQEVFSDIPLLVAGVETRYRSVSHLVRRADVGAFFVQAAVPNILLDRQKEALLTFLSVAVPLLLCLAALFGFWFSRRAMAPVSAIIAKANEIEARHLSEAIPIPESRDEIRDLAVTLNGLLRRLEKAFKSQEEFVSDASHQLKTPLAILKGELRLLQKSERTESDVEAFILSASQEIDYLSKMVEDLLMLAAMDAEAVDDQMGWIALDEKLVESISRFEKLSQSKNVRFSLNLESEDPSESPFSLRGEPELLRSLMENLLDNALKYSPVGETVGVSLTATSERLELRVEDRGPGIAEGYLEKLFERFYRSESTRDEISGSGLGLAIVRRIAEWHKGKVTSSNRSGGGACFRVTFPRNPALINNF